MNQKNKKGFINIALIVLVVVIIGAGGYFTFIKKSEPNILSIQRSDRSACCVLVRGEYFENVSNEVIWINKLTQTHFWGDRWPASSDGQQLLNDKYDLSTDLQKYEIRIPLIPDGDYDVVVVNSKGKSTSYEMSIRNSGWRFLPPLIETVSPDSVGVGDRLTIKGIFASEVIDVGLREKDTLILVTEVKSVLVIGDEIVFNLPVGLEKDVEYLISLANDLGKDNNSVVFRVK